MPFLITALLLLLLLLAAAATSPQSQADDSSLDIRRAKSSSRDEQRLKRLSRKMGSIFTLSRSPLSKSSSPELLSHDKAGLLVIKPDSVESEQSEISAYRTVRFATQDMFLYHIQTTTTVVRIE